MRSFSTTSVFLIGLLLSSYLSLAQQVVQGTVKDEIGLGLPGVNILVSGTAIGVSTDFDGNYNITVPESATKDNVFQLEYSFMGYKTSVKNFVFNEGANEIADIALSPDAALLEDVVVIGYGTVKKDDATGSVTAVSAKDFNQGAIASPQDLIVGKTSGVQITNSGGAPGAGATIRIRGGSSMTASNDPLIIIDGVPMDTEGVAGMQNPLNTINPNDIETFTVLKDASATAIYGSRASNGVILITTKQGKKGGKLRFEYGGNVSVGTPIKTVDVMDADEYRSFISDKYSSVPEATSRLGNANTDWQKEIFRTALSTDHNFSMSGGIANLPYRLSMGYTNQNGILKKSNMERTTIGLNLNPSFLDDHLKLSVNAKYMYVQNQFANAGAIGSAVAFDPTQSIYDENSPYGGYFTWMDKSGNPVPIATMNPVAQTELYDNNSDVHRYIINAKMDYKFHFLPSMVATINVGMDGSQSSGATIIQPTAAWESPNDPSRAGSRSYYNQSKNNKTLDAYLTYTEEFGKHNVKAMAGYAYQHFYRSGDNVTYAFNQEVSKPKSEFRPYKGQNYLISFFGRAEYGFDDRFLLTATLRQDGTSRFSAENRWGSFPALGFAWKINNESFMENVDNISQLKLRAGWGVTGQQNVVGSDLPYQGNYVISNGQALYPWEGGYTETARPEGFDENIKWEETVTYNFGVDFGFNRDRFTGSIDAYHRVTNDLINTVPVAAGANLTNLITTNVGNLENTGVELSLNYKPVVRDDFFWDLGFNITYNENRITKLTANEDPNYLGVETGGITGGTGSTVQIHSVNYPTNTFFVYKQVYNEAGEPLEGVYVDRNNDGVINNFDKYHLGQAAPKVLMGLNTRVEYKNWDFAASGRFQFGASIYNDNAANLGMSQDAYNGGGNYLTNRMPMAAKGFNTPQYWSDYYIQDASFFRLDNITAGYKFENLNGINNLRVYLTGQNLFTITEYEGLDPEVSSGIDNNMYPRPRTFMMGVNLGF